MNIFKSLREYALGWKLEGTRRISQEEIDAVEEATVVSSEYGPSVCMLMKKRDEAGRKVQTYVPFGRDSADSVKAGDEINLEDLKIVELSQPGKENIYRFEL